MPEVGAKLPRIREEDAANPAMLVRRMNELLDTIERRFTTLEGPLVDPRSPAAGEEVYLVSNVTEDRTFDADATSTAELADVLGTLLEDLFNEGRLR